MQRPTCTDIRVRSIADAQVIFFAVSTNVLPIVSRRLDSEERRCIRSGSVYVWEERGPDAEATGVCYPFFAVIFFSAYGILANTSSVSNDGPTAFGGAHHELEMYVSYLPIPSLADTRIIFPSTGIPVLSRERYGR